MALFLHFGCFTISLGHFPDKKSSAKSCARLQSFSLREQIIAEETASWLEASHRAITSPMIVSHHYQLVSGCV